MYHVADGVAAAVTSKNKGVFMSSLTDLVFINVLPPFLPHNHQPPHITPLFPHYINSTRCFRDHTDFLWSRLPPFCTHTHTHTHCAGFLPDSAGASLKRAMYSPGVDEAHRQTFIPTRVPLPPPRTIFTVEKVNCLKHQRCYFSWIQKHCMILNRQEITVMITNCVPTDYLHMRMGYALIHGICSGGNFKRK